MWGFTRQEQRAILFLLSAFGAGAMVWMYRQSLPAPPVNPAQAAAVEAYAKALRDDTSGGFFQTTNQRSNKTPPKPLLVDLNAATEAELVRLPGIGPVIAKRIVEYRKANGPFKQLRDLRRVKGIGAKTYEQIAPLLRIN
jgi:competence protein ComEA